MSGGQVEVVSRTIFVQDEFKRPADTTAYTAGDVVADSTGIARMLRFAKAARSPGGGGVIQSCLLVDSTAESTKPDLELYLFDSVITMQDDNEAWAPTDLEMLSFVGWISLPSSSFKTCGANGIIQSPDKALAFVCAPKAVDLFGVLVVRNAYTPVSGEQLRVKLAILAD